MEALFVAVAGNVRQGLERRPAVLAVCPTGLRLLRQRECCRGRAALLAVIMLQNFYCLECLYYNLAPG